MTHGVKIKKNIVVLLIIAVGAVSFVAVKGVFHAGEPQVGEIRRDAGSNGIISSQRRILDSGRRIGVKQVDPSQSRIDMNNPNQNEQEDMIVVPDWHVDDQHVDDQHVDDQHVDDQHVDDQHVDDQHVDDQHVDDQHVDDQHVDDQHVDDQHVDAVQYGHKNHQDDQHLEHENTQNHLPGDEQGVQVNGELKLSHNHQHLPQDNQLDQQPLHGSQVNRQVNQQVQKPVSQHSSQTNPGGQQAAAEDSQADQQSILQQSQLGQSQKSTGLRTKAAARAHDTLNSTESKIGSTLGKIGQAITNGLGYLVTGNKLSTAPPSPLSKSTSQQQAISATEVQSGFFKQLPGSQLQSQSGFIQQVPRSQIQSGLNQRQSQNGDQQAMTTGQSGSVQQQTLVQNQVGSGEHKVQGNSATNRTQTLASSQPSLAGQATSEQMYRGDPFAGLTFYDGSGNLVVPQEKWIVVTSIQTPTVDVKALSQIPGWKLVMVGDTKTPPDWKWPNVVYLGVETQKKLKLNIMKYIPYKHYARKNIGYVFAIRYGAKIIYDTDDDNKPNDGFRSFTMDDEVTTTVLMIKNASRTYNPYPHFGQQSIWPRGYPLDEVANDVPREYVLCEVRTPMLKQGIVNGDPDVDAIFRLLRRHPTRRINLLFDVHAPRVVLPPRVYAPYNSQNTISLYDAFWGLAFPVTPSFRTCDIWRSYWAQRLMWLIGTQVGFYTAGTFQFRSAHSYLADFIDEKQLYYDANRFVAFLDGWQCSHVDFFKCVSQMSYDMVDQKLWGLTDAKFIDAWLQDLLGASYKPPVMKPIKTSQCVNAPSNVIYYPQEQLTTFGETNKYFLPAYAQTKYDALGLIVKTNCAKFAEPYRGLYLNGSSLINNMLLVVHVEMSITSKLMSHLELFYRPRFGQILYCGKWAEANKHIFHKWRLSFVEISGLSSDPQMECLYKAVDMHYIVDGYLVIHSNVLLNIANMNKDMSKIWVPENWAYSSTAASSDSARTCTDRSCGSAILNLDQVAATLGGGATAPTCATIKPQTTFTYSKSRVFFVPSTFNQLLRTASRNNIDGANMAAWIHCTNPTAQVTLKSSLNLKGASQSTDYVQMFNFLDILSICPVLGFNP